METKQEFFVTLPSNVQSDSFKNTISNYKTKLKQRFEFPANEDWRVGVKQVTYNRSWFNIKNKALIEFIDEDGNIIHFPIVKVVNNKGQLEPIDQVHLIKPGFYNITELVNQINYKLSYCNVGAFAPVLHYDENRRIITIACGRLNEDLGQRYFIPIFGDEIENVLGLIDNNDLTLADKIFYKKTYGKIDNFFRVKTWKLNQILERAIPNSQLIDYVTDSFNAGFFEGPNKVDIDAGLSTIYIYTDIVEHSFVGDAYAQLLAFFPAGITKKWGDVVEHTFPEPDLIKLQSRNFDTIEIDVKDDTNKNISFETGRFTVKLLFRKYG